MNQSNDADFSKPASNPNARSIEGEIVENKPKSSQKSSCQPPNNDKVVSLVHQPRPLHRGIFIPLSDEILEGDYIEVAHRTTASTVERNRLESLITPWTMAAMLMLLTANILLSVSQWRYSSQLAAQNNSVEKATASIDPQQTLSTPRNVDLSAEKSDRLDVDVLSLAQGNPAIKPTATNTTATIPVPSLKQALLPPAPQTQQPQPNIQSYPIPAPQQPPTAIAAPPAPVPSQFPPPPPSQAVTQTVPAPSNATSPVEDFSKRHAAEQQRVEAANRPIPTLYQKTRAEGLARQYQLDPNSLTEQIQQLQTQPTNDVRQNLQNQLPPTPNNLSQPSNRKPSIERKSDGSIEIRSNNLR
jgi:hypothetical protein